MSADILQFTPRSLPTDGGKARILRKRDNFRFRTPVEPTQNDNADELLMDHADPSCMPSDSPYHAPERDPA